MIANKPFYFILTLITGMLFSSCFAVRETRQLIARENFEPYDAIIVPGVPYENDNWSYIMKARVYWSLHLYKIGIAKNIIYSGSAVYSPYVESRIMALYAEALGVPSENIFIEDKAEHSTENLYYSYLLAKEFGFERVALATDPFQGTMLRLFSKKAGLDVPQIVIDFPLLDKMEKTDPEIESMLAYVDDFTPLTERENFFQRFRGTRGKKIDFNENPYQNIQVRD